MPKSQDGNVLPPNPGIVPPIEPVMPPSDMPPPPIDQPSVPMPVEAPSMPPPAVDQPPMPQAPPVSQEVSSPPDAPKKNSPVLVIALTIFLLAILALGGYYLYMNYLGGSNNNLNSTANPTIAPVAPTNNPDPTADWKTFSDQESRFTFKYPSNWKQSENSVVTNLTPTLPSYRDSGSDYYVISTEFIDTDFNSWMQRSGTSNFTSGILNGYQTHSSYDIPGQTPGYEVLFEANNKTVGLNLFPYDRSSPDPKIIETYNQILSTFKFIEATSAASPASSPSATVKP